MSGITPLLPPYTLMAWAGAVRSFVQAEEEVNCVNVNFTRRHWLMSKEVWVDVTWRHRWLASVTYEMKWDVTRTAIVKGARESLRNLKECVHGIWPELVACVTEIPSFEGLQNHRYKDWNLALKTDWVQRTCNSYESYSDLEHFSLFKLCIATIVTTQWRSWLRHCATSWKVAGSIPDDVNGIFHWQIPSGSTMALGLTQPLTEMSTRNISWGVKAAGA